jgi:YD repeat-containing protein
VIETLSMITPLQEVDRKAIANAASVRLTLLKPQTLNERSVDYDSQGRLVKITDTPVIKGKLAIECFAHHTVLREDDADYE